MKKNIFTVIIMAMALINIVLSVVIIFVIVPTSNKTNALVAKVAQVIDLELDTQGVNLDNISVSDIETYDISDKLTIRLKDDNNKAGYVILFASLSLNKKDNNYSKLQPYVDANENRIKEIIRDEFSAYTAREVEENKELIKQNVLNQLKDLFESDFIINVSFGNFIIQ